MRLALAALMWPGADEAYYYLYTLNPALSYFDHPPMVALVGGLVPGILNWVSPLSIRLGVIILFSISIYLFYILAKSYITKKESIMAAAVFMVTPMFFISGTLLLPDAALMFFWILSLYLFRKTMMSPIIRNWLFLGAAIGLGMLSKYTAGFLYIGIFTFLLINRKYRRLIITPGPYITILVSIAVFVPVIIWNIKHDFVSFAFQTSRVGLGGFKFRYFYQSFFGQMSYLLPFVFFPSIYFAVKNLFLISKKDEVDNFSFCFGTIPVLFFMAAALFKRILPHWPLIGYMTLTLQVGRFYFSLFNKKRIIFKVYSFLHILIVILAVSLVITQIHTGILMNRELPSSGLEPRKGVRDITIDIIGWKELNNYLIERCNPDEYFLFTHKWYLGGQLAFATKGHYQVLCLNGIKDIRGFYIWQNQDKHIGRDGIFVCTSKFFKDPQEKYNAYFDSIELLKKLPIKRSGKIVKIIYLYKCKNFKKIYAVN